MAILIDERSRVLVQGLTGREGSFHALRNRDYGTRVVAGVTPGKGGIEVDGIPVYGEVTAAVAATAADVSLVLVPARFAKSAVAEAVRAGVRLIVVITEGIPVHDTAFLLHEASRAGVTVVGPNGPGVISPGRSTVGIMPVDVFVPGRVGLVSRSGTLTYQVAHELTRAGLGQSTAVGIGGDPLVGLSFVDALQLFEDDPETDAIVLIGEIGGSDEEAAAAFIASRGTKPVVAYIAGFSAPPGRQMGHAGAIVSGSSGTAQAKREAFEAVGVPVAADPLEVAECVAQRLATRARA